MEEMESVAGGWGRGHKPLPKDTGKDIDTYCFGIDVTGQKHQFEFIPAEGEDYYGITKCVLCGYQKIVMTNPSPLE